MYSFKSLKVCFIGIGSIAGKHIKNLHEICDECKIDLTVDALRRPDSQKNDHKKAEGIEQVYTSVQDMPDDYDVIFITNPTDIHIQTLQQVHKKGKHFFIEKPIVSVARAGEAARFKGRGSSVYYVACPMRYKKVLQYLKENINPAEVIGVRCCCSSYLPDWRPGTDYRECYSAKKALGGGVSIDLIHEWDYLVYLFGYPRNILCSMGKKSELDIDCEDYASYIAEYDDKVVELHLDYFGRAELREIMLLLKSDTVVGDFIDNTVTYVREGRTITFPENGNDHKKRELLHFLDMVDGKADNDNDIMTAYRTLLLTQGILEGGDR